MIGRGQVEAQHPEDRPQKALRLTKGQVKDQAERQRGFDGNLGVLQLPSALADAHGLPRGDRFRRQPQGDVASLDQCSVVRRPISDAVFRFVPGMHSRLHVEIMPLRPSRWPGPRRTLVSAHQRHYYGTQRRPPATPVPLTWASVPEDYDVQLKALRRRLDISQSGLARLVGAAGKAVVYQWEARKRTPSPLFWQRVHELQSVVRNHPVTG